MWSWTHTLIVINIGISVISAGFVTATNLHELRRGKLAITKSLYHLIIAFLLLEIAAIVSSAMLLSVLAGWWSNPKTAEYIFDASLIFGVICRLGVMYYAYQVYRILISKFKGLRE